MDPIEIINSEYQKLISKSDYSLRDYSKYLEINPSSLSKILSGQRGIPKSYATKLALKLLDNPKDREKFIEAVLKFKKKDKDTQLSKDLVLDQNQSGEIFQIISEWEYFAILNVLKLKNFDHSLEYLAKSLNISLKRVNFCLGLLQKNKFISVKNSQIKRIVKNLNTSNDHISRALKLSHLEELDLAKNRIDVDIEKKHYTSMTFTVARKDIKKLKKFIDRMLLDARTLTDKSSPEEVYLLSTQLFPLTNCELIEKIKDKKKGLKNYEH